MVWLLLINLEFLVCDQFPWKCKQTKNLQPEVSQFCLFMSPQFPWKQTLKKRSKKDKGPEIPLENLFPKLYLSSCLSRIRVENNIEQQMTEQWLDFFKETSTEHTWRCFKNHIQTDKLKLY